MFASLPFVFIL